MARAVERGFVRRKSLPRALVSRALASCGFAYYDTYLGEGSFPHMIATSDRPRSLSFRTARSEDLQRIAELRGQEAAAWIVGNQRLGGRCHVANHQGAVAGYAWANARVFVFLGQKLWDLPPGAVCIHDVYVSPAHRGKDVIRQLVTEIFRSGSADERRVALCVVDRANAPAIASFLRLGVRFRRAPILRLPGLRPVQFGAKAARGGHG